MCWIEAAVSGVTSIVGTVMGARSQAKQAEAQGKAVVTSMNRDFMNLEIQRQDSFDAAVQEITKTRLNAMQLGAGVDVAVNEDLGDSNTGKLIKRSVEADEARNVASIQDQYQAKSNEIDLNKETTLLNAKAQLKGIAKPSKTATALGIASGVVSAYTSAMEAKATANSNGMDWDFWKGATTRKKVTP
jgi:hypothetical protein